MHLALHEDRHWSSPNSLPGIPELCLLHAARPSIAELLMVEGFHERDTGECRNRYRQDRNIWRGRWHCGVMPQEMHAAFAAEGLDWRDYGFLGYDSWDATEATKDAQAREAAL